MGINYIVILNDESHSSSGSKPHLNSEALSFKQQLEKYLLDKGLSAQVPVIEVINSVPHCYLKVLNPDLMGEITGHFANIKNVIGLVNKAG